MLPITITRIESIQDGIEISAFIYNPQPAFDYEASSLSEDSIATIKQRITEYDNLHLDKYMLANEVGG